MYYYYTARKATLFRCMVNFDNPSVRRLRVVHLPLHRGGKEMGAIDHAASKTTFLRRGTQFADPSAQSEK